MKIDLEFPIAGLRGVDPVSRMKIYYLRHGQQYARAYGFPPFPYNDPFTASQSFTTIIKNSWLAISDAQRFSWQTLAKYYNGTSEYLHNPLTPYTVFFLIQWHRLYLNRSLLVFAPSAEKFNRVASFAGNAFYLNNNKITITVTLQSVFNHGGYVLAWVTQPSGGFPRAFRKAELKTVDDWGPDSCLRFYNTDLTKTVTFNNNWYNFFPDEYINFQFRCVCQCGIVSPKYTHALQLEGSYMFKSSGLAYENINIEAYFGDPWSNSDGWIRDSSGLGLRATNVNSHIIFPLHYLPGSIIACIKGVWGNTPGDGSQVKVDLVKIEFADLTTGWIVQKTLTASQVDPTGAANTFSLDCGDLETNEDFIYAIRITALNTGSNISLRALQVGTNVRAY